MATPIGNLEDMTARAVRVLGEVSLIAAEDTRHSRVLLDNINVKTPMFSCHKFNEGKRGDFFVNALLEGRDVALISDAGTPCISDPGCRLVNAAAEAGIKIVPVCGASSVVAALSVSGFDLVRFGFVGFLPKGKGAAKILYDSLCANVTVVFFESPRRISATLTMLEKNFPHARLCLCNDISKKFERIYRGTAAQISEEISQNPAAEKGEYTCVINLEAAPISAEEREGCISLEARLTEIMITRGCNLKEASQILHGGTGKGAEGSPGEISGEKPAKKPSKKELYAAMLRLKAMFSK